MIGTVFMFQFWAISRLYSAFVFGGLAYGIVGMTVIRIRWFTLPRRAPLPRPLTVTRVHTFRTGIQRVTFALNLLLLAILIAVGAEILLYGGPGMTIWLGGALQVATLTLIGTNIVWAYQRRFILAEHEAITYRIGSYRFIAVNRVTSSVVWASGTTLAALLMHVSPTFPQ